jgi:orotate phosphoribosyltransferase
LFVERPEGTFELRRGFRLAKGQRVLMVEDVVTTGLSSCEAIKAIDAAGGHVIAAASLVDRTGGSVDLGVPYFPLIAIDVPTYSADALPPELAAIAAIKPGSRAA